MDSSADVADAPLRTVRGACPHDCPDTCALTITVQDRGEYWCKAALNERARPGVVNGLGIWWRKLGVRGRNVNELTHQRLTDLGRGPSFYDCLVEVECA